MTEGTAAASKAESADAAASEAAGESLERVQQMKSRFISGDFHEACRLAQEELARGKWEVRRPMDEALFDFLLMSCVVRFLNDCFRG
jgi:hypothetical protein